MNNFNCKNLVAMGRHIPTPFFLEIAQEQGPAQLRIDSVIRIIPGKRIVALCSWKGQVLIAKLFFRRGRWQQSMLKDLKGVTQLRQAGIATPKIVTQTTTSDKQGAVLLFEYLAQGVSLLTLIEETKTEVDRKAVLEMGIEAIAQCHRSGLWQRDIHLDNFMLHNQQVYVLDGGDIMGDGKPLNANTRLQNLAVFFAQFPVARDSQIKDLFAHYLNVTRTFADNAADNNGVTDVNAMRERVIQARLARVRQLEKKLFRSTTAHQQLHTQNRFAVYDRSLECESMQSLIKNPDSLLVNARMLKQGNSSTVALVQFAGREFVLKRYNVKSLWHGLKRLLQPSRAHKSWRNAAVLDMLGIATPRAVLMLEERVLWLLRRRAWLLSEYVAGDNLLDQLQQDHEQRLPAADIMVCFKHLFTVLQDYQISHGDMKASNFIVKQNKLYVLDLDAMQRHNAAPSVSPMLQKDRDRFRRNFDGTHFESAVQQMFGELKPVPAHYKL